MQVTAIPLTAARFVLPLARRLRTAGYGVEFACGPGEGAAELLAAGFPLHCLPISRRIGAAGNLAALAGLARLLRARRFTVLHAHTPVAGLVARLAARLAGTPCVLYTLHGSVWEEGPTARSRLFSAAEWLGARCTQRVFVINDRDGRELLDRGFYRPAQVTNLGVGGSGVDLGRFNPAAVSPGAATALRAELGIPPEVPVIGYLGRTVREKGLLDLACAFSLLARDRPTAHLLIAGGRVAGEWNGVGEEEILAALDGPQDLRRRVHLTGFRADVPELLALMTVVVLPSWREGFGLALAEAGAMGLPVVATRTAWGRAGGGRRRDWLPGAGAPARAAGRGAGTGPGRSGPRPPPGPGGAPAGRGLFRPGGQPEPADGGLS